MSTDKVADYLTRVRNAIAAGHRTVEVPSSKLRVAISEVLYDKGYIAKYKVVPDQVQDTLKIALKYDKISKRSAIKKLVRISKPGLRKYTDVDNMPRVLNGMGVAILSTSKGIMTDKEARDHNVGGEILCYVY